MACETQKKKRPQLFARRRFRLKTVSENACGSGGGRRNVAGARCMAALANNFNRSSQRLTVCAAELFFFWRQTATGRVGTFLYVGHRFSSAVGVEETTGVYGMPKRGGTADCRRGVAQCGATTSHVCRGERRNRGRPPC